MPHQTFRLLNARGACAAEQKATYQAQHEHKTGGDELENAVINAVVSSQGSEPGTVGYIVP